MPSWFPALILTLLAAGLGMAALAFRRAEGARWAAGWSLVAASGACALLADDGPPLFIASLFLSTLFPFLMLSGALSYAGRPSPRWLVPAAVGAGLVRASFGAGDHILGTQLVEFTVEPLLVLVAAWVVHRHVSEVEPGPFRRLIAPGLVLVAGVEVFDAWLGLEPGGLPWLPWICVGVPLAAIQVSAAIDSSSRGAVRVKEELSAVQQRFRHLAEHSGAVIAELTADGTVVYVSPNVTPIVGLPTDRLVGRQASKLAPGFDPTRAGEPAQLHRVPTRGGGHRWLETEVTPYTATDGEARFLAVSRDVTERVDADRRGREREDSLAKAQRIAHLGSYEWDVARDELHWSDENYLIFGWDPAEGSIDNRRFFESVDPRDRERLAEAVARLLRDGTPVDLEFRIRRPDGEERVIHGRGEAVLDESGRPIRLTGTSHDVTDRTRAAHALRESEERLRAILSSLGDTKVVLFDQEGRVVSLFGHELGDELRGKGPRDLLVPDDAEEALKQVARVFDSGEVRRFRRSVPLASGISHFDVCVSPLRDASGRVQWGLAVARDVTEEVRVERERKELADRVQQAAKLESLGVLAGGIAHDFNNLLVGIQGNAELALAGLPRDSRSRRRVEEIEHASERAADLTAQLLAYAGKSKIASRDLDLSALVESMTVLLRASVSRTARLECEVAEPGPWIHGDPTQVRQVVMNLITNASDALGGGTGTVRVRAGTLRADAELLASCQVAGELQEGEYAFVEVADDGCGIDPETLERIYDPFFTTKVGGRGLGLASVLGIVRGHGGTIRVESEVGRGTRFQVLFPRVAGAGEAKPAAPDGGEWSGHGTVLVVDDEAEVRSVARGMLELGGFDVATAESGPAALAFLDRAAQAPVAVLLDLTMPEMDGEATFEALRARSPELPVVFMSGHSSGEVAARLADRPYADRMRKPFRMARLMEKLRRILEPST